MKRALFLLAFLAGCGVNIPDSVVSTGLPFPRGTYVLVPPDMVGKAIAYADGKYGVYLQIAPNKLTPVQCPVDELVRK